MSRHESVIDSYRQASERLFLLDYDGVLSPIVSRPELAKPTDKLRELLTKLANDDKNIVAIVTGRSHEEIGEWLGDLPIDISAEHGSFRKTVGGEWRRLNPISVSWKEVILPALEDVVAELPGSFIEQKATALVLHYRNADQQAAIDVLPITKQILYELTKDLPVIVQDGKMVIDIHLADADKSTAAMHWLDEAPPYDFIMIAGDDVTDEDMFRVAPEQAYTYHVGKNNTIAKISIPTSSDFTLLLSSLCELPQPRNLPIN